MFTESIFTLKCGKATLYSVLCIQANLRRDVKCVYLKECTWKAVNSFVPAGVVIIIIIISFLSRKMSKHMHDNLYFTGSSDSYNKCLNQ
jgi:hypothetical protein